MHTPVALSIDLHNETLLSLGDAARKLPSYRQGRPVSISCLWRWIMHGIQGPGGVKVRLEGIRFGGRMLTSKEALDRFAAALNPPGTTPAALPRSPTQRQAASERASQQYERLYGK